MIYQLVIFLQPHAAFFVLLKHILLLYVSSFSEIISSYMLLLFFQKQLFIFVVFPCLDNVLHSFSFLFYLYCSFIYIVYGDVESLIVLMTNHVSFFQLLCPFFCLFLHCLLESFFPFPDVSPMKYLPFSRL